MAQNILERPMKRIETIGSIHFRLNQIVTERENISRSGSSSALRNFDDFMRGRTLGPEDELRVSHDTIRWFLAGYRQWLVSSRISKLMPPGPAAYYVYLRQLGETAAESLKTPDMKKHLSNERWVQERKEKERKLKDQRDQLSIIIDSILDDPGAVMNAESPSTSEAGSLEFGPMK